MKRLWFAVLAFGGCGGNPVEAPPDMTFVFNFGDMGDVDADPGTLNECGDYDPSCTDVGFGPGKGAPFALPTDMPKPDGVEANGVSRDKNGYLGLDSSQAAFDFVYAANTGDWGRGTVSKFNSKTVREVARYYTVTCGSLKTGSTQNCDGQNGCCAMDSFPQFTNRKNNMAQGPYEQVELGSNDPSRTAVDFNGDVWVANRAFSGQSSATKIANDASECIDRNKNGKIDSSKDSNGDGIIQTDCNDDGQADDLASVKGKACTNGMAQEFFGLDDECVLFTTNTNVQQQYGRPLSLGPGALDFGASDAWAGTYNDGKFFRIDGTTGITKDMVQLPQECQPYGLVVDSTGYGWSPNLGQGLCYFNTKAGKNMEVGSARVPQDQSGYGVSLDRDQNIWVASGNAFRYTPDRTAGFQKLGQGFWTSVENPGADNGGGYGLGVAADSRTANAYFVWIAGGSAVVQIPASIIKLPMGMDTVVDGSAYPTVQVAGSAKGVGVSVDQNVFNIAQGESVITRIVVDPMTGKMTPPDLVTPPMGNNKCPAGDRCEYKDSNASDPSPYTYSDFTGFGLRIFTRPTGFYKYIQKGCAGQMGELMNGETKWVGVKWDADTPLNTSITMKARTGPTPVPDANWGLWSPDFNMSPADLVNGMPLVPNGKGAPYMQVEFDFQTMDKKAIPKLKSFDILFECIGGIG